MDAELVQLAREAVVALRQPNWAEVWALALSTLIGFGQIAVILGGLWQMNKASNARNRQLDQQDGALREQAAALRGVSQALDRQGVALERQGEVLAELLRRTA